MIRDSGCFECGMIFWAPSPTHDGQPLLLTVLYVSWQDRASCASTLVDAPQTAKHDTFNINHHLFENNNLCPLGIGDVASSTSIRGFLLLLSIQLKSSLLLPSRGKQKKSQLVPLSHLLFRPFYSIRLHPYSNATTRTIHRKDVLGRSESILCISFFLFAKRKVTKTKEEEKSRHKR